MKPVQFPDPLSRRLLLRRILASLFAACIIAGCGSSHTVPGLAALVGGAPIRPGDVQKYLDYTTSFYQWSRPQAAEAPVGRCPKRSSSQACSLLRRQVLARLIEERVVLSYAQQHHIRLSGHDRGRIDYEMQRLRDEPGGTTSLLTKRGIDPRFLRAVLERETLIRKVEDAVAPEAVRIGKAYHVEKYSIPVTGLQARSAVYRQALDLATDGRPVPPAARVRDEWLAPFRLSPDIRSELNAARPGEYAGPFLQRHAYLVIQLLAIATHPYGMPARLTLETRYFRSWLERQLRRADPQCFSVSGKRVRCPPLNT